MYVPEHFSEHDDVVVLELLRTAGFGHLVIAGASGLASTPLPFVIDDAASTVGAHLAKRNPMWHEAPCEALLVVPVCDAYVSPSWYPSRHEDRRVVPTWNYEVVHLHGHLVAHHDSDWLRGHVTELTDRNEVAMSIPWAVSDAPADFIEAQLRGIVGIEMAVSRVEAKRKLSQNRSAEDADGAAKGLAAIGHRGASVAEAMLRRGTRGERPGRSPS